MVTLTWVDGNMEVRSVSWVSSGGLLLGMLRTRADWKGVAAHAVTRYPARPHSGCEDLVSSPAHSTSHGIVCQNQILAVRTSTKLWEE